MIGEEGAFVLAHTESAVAVEVLHDRAFRKCLLTTFAGDQEMTELAREEIDELAGELKILEQKLKILLLPKDPLDERNVMLEVACYIPLEITISTLP